MKCYKTASGCGVYENYSCSECPYSKPPKDYVDAEQRAYERGKREGAREFAERLKNRHKHYHLLQCTQIMRLFTRIDIVLAEMDASENDK